MTSTESEKTKGLQEKIVGAILSAKDRDLDMISDERLRTHTIYLKREKIMTIREEERTIRLENEYVKNYMFLPGSLRSLVDDLREIRYKLEDK